jgi:tellurite resistance protein TerC
MRALFVLVEGLIRRFRYLNQTVAVVLAVVAVKLLIEDIYKVGPAGSLALVAVVFFTGIVASVIADRRDPDAAEHQAERVPGGEAGQSTSSGSNVSSSSSSSSSTASSPDSPRPPAGS